MAGWRSSIVGGTALNMVSNITKVGISLAITPFIVYEVGLRAFGFWSVALGILGYVQIADGGLPAVTLRYIAKAIARDDRPAIRESVATSLVTVGVIAAVLCGLAMTILLAIPGSAGKSLPAEWRQTAALALIALTITMIATSLSAITRGRGRWDLDSGVQICSQIASAITTVVLLLAGMRLLALGIAAVVASTGLLLGYGVLAARFGVLGGDGFKPRRSLLADFLRQGLSLQVVAFVGATNAQADRLMLLPFASFSFIGAYALGSSVAVVVRGLPLQAFGPLMTRFAAGDTDGLRETVRELYRRSMRAMVLLLVPGLLVAYFACYPAVLAWLGARYKISAAGVVVLGVGYALNLTTGPGTSLAIAFGKAELDRDYNLLGLVINIVLSAALGILIGPWGVVGATSLGLALSSLWVIDRVDRTFEIHDRWRIFVSREAAVTYLGAVLIGASIIAVTVALAPLSRVENAGLAFAGVLIGGVWIARHMLAQARRERRFTMPA